MEGLVFLPCMTVPAADFAASFDHVGFGIDDGASSGGPELVALWQWVVS